MKKNECKHPKAYISKIGKYSVCNLCGEKFYEKPLEVKKDEPVINLPKVEENIVEEKNIEPEEVVEVKEEIREEKPKKKTKKKK